MNKVYNKSLIQKVAKNIKKYRKLRKYTQATLALRASVSASTLATFEAAANDITLTKLDALACGLGVRLRDLVDFQE